MPETINTSFLGEASLSEEDTTLNETMIKVDDVSMVFNMASETMNNLKEYAIALARRELRFKEFRALDHVSLEVKKGDVFGILGTNGSGKSTLLKIIAGVLEPTEGTCTVNGSIAPLIELGAGFDMELTARENIYLNGALLGYSKKFIEEHFDEIVDFAEIENFLDMPLKNYSSGMVARIAFAIATVIVPEILIVDEVLSVGDFMFQQKCERRIQSLIKEHGVTVLIVSHSNEQIERLCNKAIWIEKGHERISGSAHEVCQVYRMLGGHFGSSESEKKVFDLFMSPIEVDAADLSVRTINGETHFGTAVKLQEAFLGQNFTSNNAILVTDDSLAVCMLASAAASLNNSPIFLSKYDSLPEITAQALKSLSPQTVTVIGKKPISPDIETQLSSITDNGFTQIYNSSLPELAKDIANFAPHSLWGTTAILCSDQAEYDLFTLSSFIYREKTPIFFSEQSGVPPRSLEETIKDSSISKVLVLGDEKSISEECLSHLQSCGVETTRLCGNNYYDANKKINSWLDTVSPCDDQTIIAVSVWQPNDALSIASYASSINSRIILEDSRDLDSIANALDTLASRRDEIDALVFLGGEVCFSHYDKELLAKAIVEPA